MWYCSGIPIATEDWSHDCRLQVRGLSDVRNLCSRSGVGSWVSLPSSMRWCSQVEVSSDMDQVNRGHCIMKWHLSVEFHYRPMYLNYKWKMQREYKWEQVDRTKARIQVKVDRWWRLWVIVAGRSQSLAVFVFLSTLIVLYPGLENHKKKFVSVVSRAVESVHKMSDSHSWIFKSPTPTPS
jgi:hypothetical protein